MNRRERLRKTRSARTVLTTDPQTLREAMGRTNSAERMPLRSSAPQTYQGGAGSGSGSGDEDEFQKLPTSEALGTAPPVSILEEGAQLSTIESYDNVDKELPLRLSPWQAIWEMIVGKGVVSYCFLAMPFALLSVYFHWGATWVFVLNFIVMIPLAAILGDFTEEVALHTNETIGGLINASFGNAVEVVVAIQALLANEIRVVQASMLGSIFSNLLLVLGSCFFFGGCRFKEQHFNPTAATANMGLLALSSIAMILPTPLAQYYELHDEHVLVVSRVAAIFLLTMYIQLLLFQLKTHAFLFSNSNNSNSQHPTNEVAGNDASQQQPPPPEARACLDHTDDEEEELPAVSLWVAFAGLLGTTLLVTVFSEFLVNSIDGFVESSGISRTFVGIILLPIVGNAVEHVTAVTVAMKDKMDLAMGVAIGSCTQISLFVVPLTVLVGWSFGKDMTLNFPQFEITLYVMSVFTVSIVLSNPTCNWLEGSMLITTYILIAVGFWFEKVMDF